MPSKNSDSDAESRFQRDNARTVNKNDDNLRHVALCYTGGLWRGLLKWPRNDDLKLVRGNGLGAENPSAARLAITREGVLPRGGGLCKCRAKPCHNGSLSSPPNPRGRHPCTPLEGAVGVWVVEVLAA